MAVYNLSTIRLYEGLLLGEPENTTLMIAIRIPLFALLLLFACFGNGSILLLLKRFKTLQTSPNIFIANLATVDLLNMAINMSLSALMQGGIRAANASLRGRLVSSLVETSSKLFLLLDVFGMMLMMIDRLCVITWGIRYKIWMCKTTALVVVASLWLACITILIPWFMTLYSVDMGDTLVSIYRMAYFTKFGIYFIVVRALFTVVFAVLGFMTWYMLKNKNKKLRKGISMKNEQQRFQEARSRTESRAATTVGMTVGAYLLSVLPLVIYKEIAIRMPSLVATNLLRWIGFLANVFQFVSSMCNPFIYMARSNRFNRALKQFFREPCGSSELRMTGHQAARPRGNRGAYESRNVRNGNVSADATSQTEPSQATSSTGDIQVSLKRWSSDISPTLSLRAYYHPKKRDKIVLNTQARGTSFERIKKFQSIEERSNAGFSDVNATGFGECSDGEDQTFRGSSESPFVFKDSGDTLEQRKPQVHPNPDEQACAAVNMGLMLDEEEGDVREVAAAATGLILNVADCDDDGNDGKDNDDAMFNEFQT